MFAKLIATNETTLHTSLPALHVIQSKSKLVKGPATVAISMPTNLNNTIQELSSNCTTNQHETTTTHHGSEHVSSSTATANWMHCSEIPITFRAQLPSLPNQRSTTKANLARQVTNVIKRHNYLTRQQITDKII